MGYNITFLQNKRINYSLIRYLLKDSEEINQFSNYGPLVKRCEKEYAERLKINTNTHEVIMTNSGTSALLVAINTLLPELLPEISCNDYNFPSVTCFNNKYTNLTILDLDSEYEQRYDSTIGNSYFGNYVEIISPIIDAAPSAYTFYKGHHISSYHKATIISLHHTKPLGFGEGGLLIINKKYAKAARDLINIPNSRSLSFGKIGGNFKQSELAAAGNLQFLMQLPELDKISEKVMEYNTIIKQELAGLDISFFNDCSSKTIYSCLPVIFNNKKFVSNINNNIEVKKYYKPIKGLPNSTNLYYKTLCYPLYYSLSYKQIEDIIENIKKVYYD